MRPVPIPMMIFVRAAECPKCGSDDLHTRRSQADPEGATVERNTRCRSCGWLFVVVVERGPDFRQDLAARDFDGLQASDMDTPDLTSIGQVATQYGRSVAECRRVMSAFDITATLRLGGVDYFDRAQVKRFGAALQGAATHGIAGGVTEQQINERLDRKARQFERRRPDLN